jgi:hypothetical protein
VTHLLQWYNLIFELPAALAAILLVLSTVRIGHGSTHHSGTPTGGHAPPLSAHQVPGAVTHPGHAAATHGSNWRSAPLTAVAGFFGLFWGIAGFMFNTVIIGLAVPATALILESLGVACIAGLIAARGGAELFARVMPPDQTFDVSHEGLYGLTAEAVFEVTADAGRLLVYDEHGTLHDELCRAAHAGETIAKGAHVRIIDKDKEGHLLVEEVF